MKHNNSSFIINIIIPMIFLMDPNASVSINTKIQNCDVSMNQFYGNWNNSALSCVKHAIKNVFWLNFTGDDDEVDAYNYFQQLSSFVSSDYIRTPSEFCGAEYPVDIQHTLDCLNGLTESFQINDTTTRDVILGKAIYYHKQQPAKKTIDQGDPEYNVTVHKQYSYVYYYLQDIADLIISNDSINKHFGHWSFSILSSVKYAITNLSWSSFGNEEEALSYFQNLSNLVSADYIRDPNQFCSETYRAQPGTRYQEYEESYENCLAQLYNIFKDDTTRKCILHRAILYHRQNTDEDINMLPNDDNSALFNEHIHPIDSFVYKYLDDIASRITSIETLDRLYQKPLHFCSGLYNITLNRRIFENYESRQRQENRLNHNNTRNNE